jgi:hypothetical protein
VLPSREVTRNRRLRRLLLHRENAGIFYPDPTSGPYFLQGHWSVDPDADRPCLVGITVWKQAEPAYDKDGHLFGFRHLAGAPPVPDISGTDLRDVTAVARVKEALWEELLPRFDLHEAQYEEGLAAWMRLQDELAQERTTLLVGFPTKEQMPRGRPGRVKPQDSQHFRAVAAVYKAALRDPGRRQPTTTVMRHWNVSYSTASKWVRRAREDFGYLPPTSPGRASVASSSTKAARVK